MFVRIALVLCTVMLMAGNAGAEHKLLVTDVLDKGEVEAEADIGYSFTENTFTVLSPYYQEGKVAHRVSYTNLALDLGITRGVQVGVSVPYVFSDRLRYSYSNPSGPLYYASTEGWGDVSINIKERLLGGGGKPFVLVAGADFKLDTANPDKEGTGTSDIAPYLAVSTVTAGNTLRPYASYQAVFRNHGASDIHVLSIGTEYAASRGISLVPFANLFFRTDSNAIEGYQSYIFGLKSFIQTAGNFYLVPTLSYVMNSSTRTIDHTQDLGTLDGYNAILGLYYLFK